MTLEEMQTIKWVVPWSGGKDSTATIILMHENNIPIKTIYHMVLMYDDKTPATLEIMNKFRYKAAEVFKSWGYNVEIIKSKHTAIELANRTYKRSKRDGFNGKRYGVAAFMRLSCCMQNEKVDNIYKNDFQMIGYAADEPERVSRLSDKKASILAELNITENDAFNICRQYGLLSPYYDLGIKRDGCFFCPCISIPQRKYLKENEPELYKKAISIVSNTDPYILEHLQGLKANGFNHWLEEYDKCKNTL